MQFQLIVILLVALVLILLTVQNPNPRDIAVPQLGRGKCSTDRCHTDFTDGGNNYVFDFKSAQAGQAEGKNSQLTKRNRRSEISPPCI